MKYFGSYGGERARARKTENERERNRERERKRENLGRLLERRWVRVKTKIMCIEKKSGWKWEEKTSPS